MNNAPDYEDNLAIDPSKGEQVSKSDFKRLREHIRSLKDKIHLLKKKLAQKAPELTSWLDKNFNEED